MTEKIDTTQEMILTALSVKFGRVPEGLERSIRRIHDEFMLTKLVDCATHVSSLDEFFEKVIEVAT